MNTTCIVGFVSTPQAMIIMLRCVRLILRLWLLVRMNLPHLSVCLCTRLLVSRMTVATMLLTSLGESPSACLWGWPLGSVTASSISLSCASICSLVGRAARAELVGVGVGIAERRDSGA